MSTTIHINAVVQPDGTVAIPLPDVQPGQTVSLTIQMDVQTGETLPSEQPTHLTAVELLKLPRDERERLLAVAAEEAESEYLHNPALSEFEAFGEDDQYDEYPK